MRKILNEGNKYTILYCVCENFSDSIILRFRIRFRNRNKLRSGSDFLARYGSGSASQKVTVPTVPVPVPHRWLRSHHVIKPAK
jgi:hypothetical protein